MKTLIAILFTFFTYNFCYSQDKLDTTWKINNHQFRVILERDENDSTELKTQMTLLRDNQLLHTDSLMCCALRIDLSDINSDGYHDLRVFQCSGARANETFNLYLFQESENSFKKVKGFEDWPNLMPTKVKGILASTILTGTVEYRFFKIEEWGELIDLNISVEDKGYSVKGYDKGLRKAKRLQKKSSTRRTTSSFIQ